MAWPWHSIRDGGYISCLDGLAKVGKCLTLRALLEMKNRATDPDHTDERQLSLRRHNVRAACRGLIDQGEAVGSSGLLVR